MSITAGTTTATDRLLEREDALEALSRALAEAASGTGRLVLVRGEAGAGKTALVRQFCDENRGRARILWGACDPLDTPRPLGPFSDIAQVVGGELEEVVDQGAVPYRVATALMKELRTEPPTIVTLEDLHWADEATLDVVKLVARRVDAMPAVVVTTYRDDGLDSAHPLRTALGALPPGPASRRLEVPALSPDAVASLAEPHGVDPAELYRITSGNAFFVTEVLAATATEIPETVRDAVLARAASLSRSARAVLEAVAVVPPEADLPLLEALVGSSDQALDECLASGMLTARNGSVVFRHELARLAVEDSLPTNRRLALHREALTALRALPPDARDLSRLAHHAEAAQDLDAVLEFAPLAAARAASMGAHREAAAHYDRAIRFSARLPASRRAELLAKYAHECYLTDRIEEAIDALKAAADSYRELGDPLREGDTLCALSNILWCPGRGEEARRVGHDAVTILETLPPGPELVGAYRNLSFLHLTADDFEAAHVWGERALELANRLGRPEFLLPGLVAVGRLEFMTGSDAGREKLERARDLAQELGLEDWVGEAFLALAWATVLRRTYALAGEFIDDGIDWCHEHGLHLTRLYLLALRARIQREQGAWGDAAESAALVIGERCVSTLPRTSALVTLALVRARRGDPGADSLLAEAQALAAPTRELVRIAPVAAARAEAAWLSGRPETVREATGAALELALERGVHSVVGELLVWRRRAGIEEAVAVQVPKVYELELAGEAEGAAEWWAATGCPYEAALALADSDDEAALRRALETLRSLGARPAAAIVLRRLRELGVRGISRGPRPTTRSNPAQLTNRELEVLHLVAEGLRNVEIARRLFLSPRTVGHHVSAILRKLGVATRGEAAAAAARLDLLEDR